MKHENSSSKLIVFLFSALLILSVSTNVYGEMHQDPNYEKWSKIALSALKKEYKDAEFTDYKYVGRQEVSEEEAKDVFRVRVNQNGESFTAQVDIVLNPKKNELITVKIVKMQE
ncbi:DUF3889 domain-containing protein [Metabacillus herbersteinensis]|uniref:DUF3889 domain-containing protein n=1 Tax=Metabacillus herbersteinensis TaxID=283816 RepID=A0ABV6GEQ4_9BACI